MSRVNWLRSGAAVLGATATALLAVAMPAGATDPAKATGKVNFKDDHGVVVNLGQQGYTALATKLIGVEVGGKTLQTYCVELHRGIDEGKNRPDMVEVDWDKYPNADSPFRKNNAKINWILQNGFPTVGAADLAKNVTGTFKDGLSKEEAIAATQSAIWYFSDNAKLVEDNPTPNNPDAKDDVLRVYKWLLASAKDEGAPRSPQLNLTPKTLAGEPGKLIGPFTVATTAANIAIIANPPAGVTFTDKDGKELPKAEVAKKIQQLDKYDFYVKVAADAKTGKVDFTVAGDTEVSLGRLFVSENYAEKPSQSLILAKSDNVRLEVKGSASWKAAGTAPTSETTTPAPTTTATTATTSPAPAPQAKNDDDQLANTGASIFVPAAIGVVLIGAGVGALVFQRRRKRA